MSLEPCILILMRIIQPNQINMAELRWYLIKSDLCSVRYCVNWTSHFLQGTAMFNRSPCTQISKYPTIRFQPIGIICTQFTQHILDRKYLTHYTFFIFNRSMFTS